jgi:hypothetical protein
MTQYDVQRKATEQKNSGNSSARTVQLKHNNVESIIQMAKMNPEMLTQNDVMVLQKTMGNGTVSQLLKGAGDKQNDAIQKKDGKLEENESIQTKKENNTGLPDNLKDGVENLSGIDMSDVRVHYNSDRPASVGALAYTQGTDIHVAPGQEKHLAHEAWHVVQQAQGRVQATTQMKGVAVNDDVGLEKEADLMGAKALSNTMIQQEYLIGNHINNTLSQSSVTEHNMMQLLSDFDLEDWKDELQKGKLLRNYRHFKDIITLIDKCDKPEDEYEDEDEYNYENEAEQEYKKALREAITKLGEDLLAQDDTKHIYNIVNHEFNYENFTPKEVEYVKKYNFDGQIDFTAENYAAWMNLAEDQAKVDDFRYIYHELIEVAQLNVDQKAQAVKRETNDEFSGVYRAAHKVAIQEEVKYLAKKVNEVNDENYTWQQVVASDLERGEEFMILDELYEEEVPDENCDEDVVKYSDNRKRNRESDKYFSKDLQSKLTDVKKVEITTSRIPKTPKDMLYFENLTKIDLSSLGHLLTPEGLQVIITAIIEGQLPHIKELILKAQQIDETQRAIITTSVPQLKLVIL